MIYRPRGPDFCKSELSAVVFVLVKTLHRIRRAIYLFRHIEESVCGNERLVIKLNGHDDNILKVRLRLQLERYKAVIQSSYVDCGMSNLIQRHDGSPSARQNNHLTFRILNKPAYKFDQVLRRHKKDIVKSISYNGSAIIG